tara:strand:+ start:289 stop:504 length:216 start_codon:yes stop_codon:yes gene_type:complete
LSHKAFSRTAARTAVCAWWDKIQKKGTWVIGPQKKFFLEKIKMAGKVYNSWGINKHMRGPIDIGRLHGVSV